MGAHVPGSSYAGPTFAAMQMLSCHPSPHPLHHPQQKGLPRNAMVTERNPVGEAEVELPTSLPKLRLLRLYTINMYIEGVTDATTTNPFPALTSLKAYECPYICPILPLLKTLKQLSLSDLDHPTGVCACWALLVFCWVLRVYKAVLLYACSTQPEAKLTGRSSCSSSPKLNKPWNQLCTKVFLPRCMPACCCYNRQPDDGCQGPDAAHTPALGVDRCVCQIDTPVTLLRRRCAEACQRAAGTVIAVCNCTLNVRRFISWQSTDVLHAFF